VLAQRAVAGRPQSQAMGCTSSTQAAVPAEVITQAPEEPKWREPEKPKRTVLRVGDTVYVSAEGGGYEAEMLKLNTTDVLVKRQDGTEGWVDIEDITRLSSPPPLLTEVKVGVEVTTALGVSGTVTSRTTTEVCLRSAGGKDTCVPIEDVTVLEVSILGALDLHNKDWIGKSDPYCACQLDGKPGTRVQTKTVTDRLDPTWNHEVGMLSYVKGDALRFEVFDQDQLKKDDFLGQCTLESERFHPSGFYGELQLLDSDGKPGMGTLKVKVVPRQLAAEPEPEKAGPEPEKTEPEVQEVPDSKKSYCC